PAQSLRIANTRKREHLRVPVAFFDLAIEQGQLLAQRRMTIFRQRQQQVFDHGAQASRDLQIARAAIAYLAECEMDEIFPVWRSKDHKQSAGFLPDLGILQVSPACRAKQAVKLIEGKNRRRRIVDGG